jgi:hypothetical protein
MEDSHPIHDSTTVLEQTIAPTTNELTAPTDDDSSSSTDTIEQWSTNITLNKMLPFEPGPILLDTMDPTAQSKIIDPHIIRKMHPARMVLHDQLQGDTGANCGATHDASILWYYKLLKRPIPITTYSEEHHDEPSCVAIGTGILKIIANDNTITNWTMLHTPGSTGTILSPDRYMKDAQEVHEFRHHGSMDNKGKISFHNLHGTTISEITMTRRRDGLWFTTNPILKPPTTPPHTPTPRATDKRTINSVSTTIDSTCDNTDAKPTQESRQPTQPNDGHEKPNHCNMRLSINRRKSS